MQTSNRFAFLDGIRALAALYVFISHAYQLHYWMLEDNSFILFLMSFGEQAVITFIVLSGFCLGLQIDKPQTFWGFIGSRSRRILPPYFAAVALLSLLVMAKCKVMGIDLQMPLTEILPSVLMIKEWVPDDSDWLTGSAVFWSIGLEYRIYWFFPLLAWIYKRYFSKATSGI